MKLKTLSKWLVVIGALEVGLMSMFDFDFVGSIFGKWPAFVSIIYALIGLSAVWGAYAMLTKKK